MLHSVVQILSESRFMSSKGSGKSESIVFYLLAGNLVAVGAASRYVYVQRKILLY